MAKDKHTKIEQYDFNRRLNKIFEWLPENYVALVMSRLPGVDEETIKLVRYNKIIDFEILKIMEELVEQIHDKMTK